MYYVLFWLNYHRIGVVIVLALAMWCYAYGLYFHPLLIAWMNRGKPHNWSVDLVTKKAVSRGKVES